MTPNTKPIFVLTPHIGAVSISTANTNRDGTGTIGTCFTAGANGSRINRVTVKSNETPGAGMVRLYLHDGSSYYLWKESKVTAITPSATVKTFEEIIPLQGENALVLPSGWSLRASTHLADTFLVIAEGGDY